MKIFGEERTQVARSRITTNLISVRKHWIVDGLGHGMFYEFVKFKFHHKRLMKADRLIN